MEGNSRGRDQISAEWDDAGAAARLHLEDGLAVEWEAMRQYKSSLDRDGVEF